jgi:hypothetical protein
MAEGYYEISIEAITIKYTIYPEGIKPLTISPNELPMNIAFKHFGISIPKGIDYHTWGSIKKLEFNVFKVSINYGSYIIVLDYHIINLLENERDILKLQLEIAKIESQIMALNKNIEQAYYNGLADNIIRFSDQVNRLENDQNILNNKMKEFYENNITNSKLHVDLYKDVDKKVPFLTYDLLFDSKSYKYVFRNNDLFIFNTT